jgi:ATP-dependent helicase/nuclease subunit A
MYEQINTEMKAAEGQMDFSDANHYALRILKDSEIAAEIRERFDHIFIDEYQDSNYIQEEIISAIKKDDNLFMVGDIKQSIYGFRLAEPDIFRSRYKRYAAIQAGCLKNDNGSGRKIDLNTNFRSKQSVIDSVNDIFKELMHDYDENAMLYRGDQYDGPISHKSELYIIDKKASEEDTSGITSAVDPTDTINGSDTAELRSLKNIEIEAYLVADVIKENIGRSIFDSKKNEVRKIEKKDIVILLRSAKNRADKVYDILMKQGIEAIVDDNSGYFESIEIETLTDMLRVIDNRHQDIPLLSVLRSGIFGFTIDELIKIGLASDQGDHYDAFRAYALYDSCDPVLREKVLKTISIIDDWSERSVYLSAEELVSEIISSSGYYA